MNAAWHYAVVTNSPVVYKDFYSKYSDSPYAITAMKLSVQPKMLPLYQPTKIMVAPQIAPQVKLTNFNGVNIGQGNNAPIGLGGNGSLFNKKFGNQGTQGLGGQNLGQGLGNGNQGIGGQNLGQKLGLPGNQQNGNPIATINNGGNNVGQGLNNGKPLTPGVDLAKGVKRLDGKIEGGRLTTLPQVNQTNVNPNKVGGQVGTTGNGAPTTGIGTVVKKEREGLNGNTGNTGIGGRITTPTTGNQVLTNQGNSRPLIKQVDRPRIINQPTQQITTTQTPAVKKFQPTQRLFNNGGGNGGGGGGSNMQLRSTTTVKPMSFSSGGGGGGGSSRFASGGGGGMGFRSFR